MLAHDPGTAIDFFSEKKLTSVISQERGAILKSKHHVKPEPRKGSLGHSLAIILAAVFLVGISILLIIPKDRLEQYQEWRPISRLIHPPYFHDGQ